MENTVTLPQSPQTIISTAINERLDYEEWALAQIDAGLADIKAGRVYSRDEAYQMLGMVKHERKKAA